MQYDTLKYHLLQALVLAIIFTLYFFTVLTSDHSMRGQRSATQQASKARLMVKIDSLPRVLEARASFNRLKKSWDEQRRFANSQLAHFERLNQQGANYVVLPLRYQKDVARADSSEAAELAKLDRIKQQEAARIEQDQIVTTASVTGTFIDYHPSVILSTLALLFSALVFISAFNVWYKLGLGALSLAAEMTVGLGFGLDFYKSYLSTQTFVYLAAIITSAGIWAAYSALWRVFWFLMVKAEESYKVAQKPKIEGPAPTVAPKVEAPNPEPIKPPKMARDPKLIQAVNCFIKLKKGDLKQKDACVLLEYPAWKVSRLLDRTDKLAQQIKQETGMNGLATYQKAAEQVLTKELAGAK